MLAELERIKQTVRKFEDFVPSLRAYYLKRCDFYQAGGLGNSIEAWKQLTSDQEILRDISGVHIPCSYRPEQHLAGLKNNIPHIPAIDMEINKMLSKGIIESAISCKDEILSSIFTRPKKDGSYRIILNLKQFNKCIPYQHFKMDTLKSILNLIEKDCFLASLDLKDAYYSVPVARDHRKYLRFLWRGQLYQFTCLPNGLSCCPRKFTKLMKPPMTALHRLGHIASNYIDDLILQGRTYTDCVHNVIDTVSQLDPLGFVIHPDKSVFIPTQVLVVLGFVINTVTMTIYLTAEKAASVQQACRTLLERQNPTIRDVAQVTGKIVATFPGVMHGPLFYRALEKDKSTALKKNKGNFDRPMTLSASAKNELSWWVNNILSAFNRISHPSPSLIITSDASHVGWGAACDDTSTGGTWSAKETQFHINYLELLAAFFALKIFAKNSTDEHVRLMIDNTTAVSVINHMGTSHSDSCHELSKEIWAWCIPRGIWISAAHIPGKENTVADHESRKTVGPTEWKLDPNSLDTALKQLQFRPEIDLFASRVNCQFPRYCSFKPDPGAEAIDAFTITWHSLNFYAFPPFSIVSAVLKKITSDKGEGICILPNWPTQPWYPKAMKMLTQPPVELKPRKDLLTLPSDPSSRHPLHTRLRLLVCHLSGNN